MPSLLLLVPLVALAAAVAGPAPVRIVLEFDPLLPAVVSRLALDEAAAIWRGYGVSVVGETAMPTCGLVSCLISDRLAVRIDDDPSNGDAQLMPLGGIRFQRDGTPERVVRLRYRTLVTKGLATVTVAGLPESQWPRSMRDFVVGRIVGRVVAHEIGHWLLQTRDHSSVGLMRAVQQTRELAEPARVNYSLTPALVGRLNEIVARQLSARAF